MKKSVQLMLLGLLVFPLAACNNAQNSSDDVNEEETVVEVSNETEETNAEEETAEEWFVYWAEWEWEFAVDTAIAKFTVPAWMKYEVESDYISDDNQIATIELSIQPLEVFQLWNFKITNQGMVDSYEKAIEHTIALQNLDTYDNWSSELLDEVEYNGIKYQTIKTTTEYGSDYFLAWYKWGWEIVVKMPEEKGWFEINGPEVKALLESLTVVDL